MTLSRGIVLASVIAELLASACGTSAAAPVPLTLDRFGGFASLSFVPTGYFRLQHTAVRDWLVDPDGHAFYSAGVNHVAAAGDAVQNTNERPYHDAIIARYGSDAAWANEVVRRLTAWHLNTVGAWSDYDRFSGRMPYTVVLNLAQGSWHPGSVTDVFSAAWAQGVRQQVASGVAPRANDPWLVGYFTDNELRWTRDWTALNAELFDSYMTFPADAAGKAVLIRTLEQRYSGDVAAFNRVWDLSLTRFSDLLPLQALVPGPGANSDAVLADKRAFLAVVAERYFSFTTDAIRAVDPHHLILGCRFVPMLVPQEVLEAAARHVDVISVNNYVFLDGVEAVVQQLFGPIVSPDDFLSQFEAISGRPLLVSEFGFRAADAGLPNSWPPEFPVYKTQAGRADATEAYLRAGLAAPYVVGLHWFEYEDEPAAGRFDGEDNNLGLVNVDDDPYQQVVERIRAVYGQLWPQMVAQAAGH